MIHTVVTRETNELVCLVVAITVQRAVVPLKLIVLVRPLHAHFGGDKSRLPTLPPLARGRRAAVARSLGCQPDLSLISIFATRSILQQTIQLIVVVRKLQPRVIDTKNTLLQQMTRCLLTISQLSFFWYEQVFLLKIFNRRSRVVEIVMDIIL